MAQESRLAVTIDSRGAKRNADELSQSLSGMEKAGDAATRSADALSASLDEQRKDLAQLLGQINPTVGALGKLDDQQEKLSRFRKAGLLDSETFTEYSQRITTLRETIGDTSGAMAKAGMSARAYQAALRGVPAQFTDIVVSLQGGQAPLTVLLQQGGQLKDMFGGIGPAAQALGGYIAGLVNPFTIAATAAGAFGFAAYKGYEQAEVYRKALISTGAAAGRTTDELVALSAALANGRNFSAASQAVIALAGNGRLVGDTFREVARAATEIAVATGKSSAEIADQLSSEKAGVTDLAAEYSEKYGVITQAVFTQVRSLELQGRHMEAVRVLAGAVADEMSQRNKEMVESTRGLAAAWDGVKSSVAGAWNELKTGLSASPELFRLQHLQQQLQTAQEIGDKALIAGLEKQIQLAQKAVDAQSEKAKASAEELRDRKVSVAAEKAWYDTGKKYQTDEQRRDADIAKARKQGLEAKKSEAEIEKRIAEIRDEYAKKQPKVRSAPQNRGVAEAENAFSRLYAQYDPASQAARTLTKEQTQLQLALDKGKISQDEYGKALAQASINYAAAIKGAQGLTQAEQYRAQLDRQLATQRAQYDAEAAAVGMGSLQAERMQQRIRLEQETNDRILQLRTELANATTEKQRQELQAQIDLTTEYLPKQLQAMQVGWGLMDQQMLNATNGWTAALQDFQNSANDVAGQTQSMFSSAFYGISADAGRAFEGMVFDGMTFSDAMSMVTENMLRGMVSALGEMAAQWAANQALQLAFGKAQTAEELARVATETTAKTASIATVKGAKIAADGAMTASGLAATATTTAAQTAAAATTASAWLPAALVASIGSFGAAAVVGGTALLAAFALTKGFKTGGYVSGAGTGTSDSIPARLSNGEFVVNADATKRNRALLEAINSNERVSISGGGGRTIVQSGGGRGDEKSAASGGGALNVPIQVVVQAQPGMSDSEARRQGQMAGEGVRDIVRQVIQDEMRPGGMLT